MQVSFVNSRELSSEGRRLSYSAANWFLVLFLRPSHWDPKLELWQLGPYSVQSPCLIGVSLLIHFGIAKFENVCL
jgi:hypothetical protein